MVWIDVREYLISDFLELVLKKLPFMADRETSFQGK